MIRKYYPSDLMEAARIHEKHYAAEFELPMFDTFVSAFTTVENNEIISVGGIRTILEAIIVTDKDKPATIRENALHDMLEALIFSASNNKYNEIHASIINDSGWLNRLYRSGFKPTKGQMIVYSW